MATTLTASVSVKVSGKLVEGALDVGAAQYSFNDTITEAFADGSGANQAHKVFADTRTITASSNDDLDFAGGLTDGLGNAITFTSVKGLIVTAADANTNNVVIGGEGTNPFSSMFSDATDKLVVKPGGTVVLLAPGATGYAVTASTGDILRIANGGAGTSVTYTIYVIGETS